jgi:hypothetical protein
MQGEIEKTRGNAGYIKSAKNPEPTKTTSKRDKRSLPASEEETNTSTPPKRVKHKEFPDNREQSSTENPIIQVFDESNLKPKKTRSQARKEILQELKEAIAAEPKDSETPKKAYTMSGAIPAKPSQEQVTPKSSLGSTRPTSSSAKPLTIFTC